MPISDRDYMKNEPPRSGQRKFQPPARISINPLLVLVVINVVFFIGTMIAPSARYSLGEGAMIYTDRISFTLGFSPTLIADHPWTFITYMFIHDGFMHFLFNMFALFIFGQTLRRFIGDNTFLLVYFVGGLGASLLYWVININEPSLMVGASGAVYTIAGALVMLVPKMRIALWGIIPMPLWVFVLVFLVILSLPGLAKATTAWQAHFGGLIVGVIAGFIFRRRLRFLMY